MSVPLAYLAVIMIWTTTPLAIQWSGEGSGFLFGVAARMAVGLAVLLVVIPLARSEFPWNARALKVYLVSGSTVYVAMIAVYWAAQHIPSGWIAVIFGLSPILTGVFAVWLLNEPAFRGGRLLGMMLGVLGLALMLLESAEFPGSAWLGVLAVGLSATVHSAGAVLLKWLRPGMPSQAITAGGLILATPLFAGTLMLGGGWPEVLAPRAVGAILYLGLFGTAIGFPLYFFLLKRIHASRVALMTLVTPVTALTLGVLLNGEPLSARVIAGALAVIAGLFCYEFLGPAVERLRM